MKQGKKLDGERKELDEEGDDLEDRKEKFKEKTKKLEKEDEDLRADERRLRRGWPGPPRVRPDPNCRGADCQGIRRERAANRQGQTDHARQQPRLDLEQQQHQRREREWQAESDDLAERMDRGEGQTKTEHKARITRKAAERAEAERQVLAKRYWELHLKNKTRYWDQWVE